MKCSRSVFDTSHLSARLNMTYALRNLVQKTNLTTYKFHQFIISSRSVNTLLWILGHNQIEQGKTYNSLAVICPRSTTLGSEYMFHKIDHKSEMTLFLKYLLYEFYNGTKYVNFDLKQKRPYAQKTNERNPVYFLLYLWEFPSRRLP